MRYGRRGTSLLVAALVLAAGLAGAAPTEEGSSGPMEIEWIGSWTYSVPEDALVVTRIEERFGVDLKLKQVDLNDPTERDLLVSSGELPDVGEFIRGQDPYKMYQDGLMRSIPKQMIRDHAPNMTEHYDRHPAIWLMANPADDAEAVYVLAAYKGGGQGVSDLPKIRLDWIENVGIPFDESLLIDYTPTGKDPQFDGRYQFYDAQITIDELEAIMYAFRDGDPDGNGKNDTVAHAVTAAHRGIRPISGAFGVDGWVYWWTYFDEGETKLGVTSDRWREGLRTLSKWYADKLIPQQLPDFKYNDAWALIGEGRSGIWTDGVGFGNETRPPMNILMRDPEANVVVVPGVHRSGRIRRRAVGLSTVGRLRRVRRARGRQRREARKDPGDRRLDQLDPRGVQPHLPRHRGPALRVGRRAVLLVRAAHRNAAAAASGRHLCLPLQRAGLVRRGRRRPAAGCGERRVVHGQVVMGRQQAVPL